MKKLLMKSRTVISVIVVIIISKITLNPEPRSLKAFSLFQFCQRKALHFLSIILSLKTKSAFSHFTP